MTRPRGRLALRQLVPGDAEAIATWAEDAVFRDHAEWGHDRTVAEIATFHRRLIASPPGDLIRLGAIDGDRLVGYVDLHGVEPLRRELGFLVGGRDRWREGLGTLAGAAGLDHGFETMGLDEIWAEAFDANEPSLHILRRLGLTETGPGAESVFLGETTRYRRFAITRDQWHER